jgi:hypothetical protein
MNNLFHRHPASVGETYLQHMGHAAAFGGWMALGAACCLIHAILPFLFEKTGSRIIARLHDRIVVNRRRLSDPAPAGLHGIAHQAD